MTTFHHTEKQPQMGTDKHGLDLIPEKIIGYTFEVSSALVSVFLEKVYQNALLIELRNTGLQVEKEKIFRQTIKGKLLGIIFLGFLVNQAIIVEIKAVQSYN